jgi:pimeloyl-ACP methyl ester carboxylesterase
MRELASTSTGQGPTILLIHGGMTDGPLAWWAQAPLADRWRLVVVDRAGYGASASLSQGEDIELDAQLIAATLGEPVHIVGHSSGAIVAMLAAARAPEGVRSLTLIEPPSYRFVDDPGVQALADSGDSLWDAVDLSDRDWVLRFLEVYGEEPLAEEVLAMLTPHVPTFRRFVRRPYDIELPVEQLNRAPFPILVVSGGHSDSFELLNDRIAEAVGARRAVVKGFGHEVQMAGAPFNEVLAAFCLAAATAHDSA